MPRTTCVIPFCSDPGYHIIPRDKSLRDKWIHSIKRGKTKFVKWSPPSKYSYVCKNHFTEDNYISLSYHGTTMRQRRLKKTAVPSRFSWTNDTPTPAAQARKDRSMRRKLFRDQTNVTIYEECEIVTDSAMDIPYEDINIGACEIVEMDNDVLEIETSHVMEKITSSFMNS